MPYMLGHICFVFLFFLAGLKFFGLSLLGPVYLVLLGRACMSMHAHSSLMGWVCLVRFALPDLPCQVEIAW